MVYGIRKFADTSFFISELPDLSFNMCALGCNNTQLMSHYWVLHRSSLGDSEHRMLKLAMASKWILPNPLITQSYNSTNYIMGKCNCLILNCNSFLDNRSITTRELSWSNFSSQISHSSMLCICKLYSILTSVFLNKHIFLLKGIARLRKKILAPFYS